MIKYSKKQHINNLLKKGVVRIGTLHEYRNSEYSEGIHDNTEGLKRVHLSMPGGVLDLTLQNEFTEKVKNVYFGGRFTGNPRFTMTGEGPIFSQEISERNCFIFCTSSCRVDLIPEIFGYDAGVKIINPENFINAISKAMRVKFGANLFYFGEIGYQDKEEEWNRSDLGENPALYKDISFSYQREIRAIWMVPDANSVTPVTLQIPELTKYTHSIRL